MNVATLNDARQRENAQRLAVIDCDIHPAPRSPADLQPWLAQRWRDHMNTFGAHVRQGLTGQEVHPRMMARGMRADAFPEDGPAGSDLELMRRQHLDLNGVEYAMMIPLGASVIEERNPHYAAALSHAANEWQLATWIEKDHRLKGAVIIPQEDVETSVEEIDKRAGDSRFRQIIMSPKPVEPLGRKRYWPIYEAASRAGLPIAFHPVLAGGGHPSSGIGWPTYYMQDHYTFGGLMQNIVASMVFEGVFEQFPDLKIVSVENGFAWVPNLVLAHGQAFRAHARRGSASEEQAVGVCPAQSLVHHAADGRDGKSGPPARHHGLDRLGPAAVLQRLSALGFRRPALCLPHAPDAAGTGR